MDDMLKIGFSFLVLNDDHTWRRASYDEWFAGHKGEVSTRIATHSDEYAGVQILVSTVFVHIAPQIGGQFETMAFANDRECGCWRYDTWDEAVAGHANVVATLEKNIAARSLPTKPQATLIHAE